ncbi:CpaD family pilus assembly lipoprotein [Sphingomonas sp.]|uniref:CpaD family pilus assembly lipoprotein n=1 Tax=Sphingomonas sp. TaxID=28214 RepID=UPI002EDADEE9
MFKHIALPLLLVPAALLGGCGTYNGGVESIHQPVVQRTDYALDLAAAGDSLAPGESERLGGWLRAMRPGYGDRISVDDGAGGVTGRAEVAAEANRFGLMLADNAPVTAGTITPGTVRVVMTRMTASVPSCPDFSRTYQPDYQASTTSNFGCATNKNLAAMIANPADLVRGEPGSGTADPFQINKSIKALREAAPSGGGGTTVKAEGAGGSK